VERGEAEAIYEQGREAVVAVLLRMDEQIQRPAPPRRQDLGVVLVAVGVAHSAFGPRLQVLHRL